MSITALFLIVAIGLAIGALLTVPSLRATQYMGLAGASVTLIGASIGLASGSSQAVFIGGVLALVSGLLGIGIGFVVWHYRRSYSDNR